MYSNNSLSMAKKVKNDEFYTRWEDIEREVNAYLDYNPNVFEDKIILLPCDDPFESNFFKFFATRFKDFGLKELIATSYAGSPISGTEMQLSLFDEDNINDAYQITLTSADDYNHDGVYNFKDVVALLHDEHQKLLNHQASKYLTILHGDNGYLAGDFRSREVIKLRNKADIIITNPPFSLFREFISWINPEKRKFLCIANQNDISDKEVFPLLKNNIIWLGVSNPKEFIEPDGKIKKMGNICWFTNLDHGRRHEPLRCMTMADNLRFNKKLNKKLSEWHKSTYPKYDNYDAIEVPYVNAIPSDYDKVMGVPITFLNVYDPQQFEIVGTVSAPSTPGTLNLGKDYSGYIGFKQNGEENGRTGSTFGKVPVIVMNDGKRQYYEKDGIQVQATYPRIFIKWREDFKN